MPINEKFSRTERLIGTEAMEKLAKAHVAVFGVGGVGGHVCEALIRSGVGSLDIIDNDVFSESNLNRQLFSLSDNIGCYKVDEAEKRLLQINPEAVIRKFRTFYTPETSDEFDFTQYDYVIDAIDTVTGKIGLIMQANESGVPIISSMGAGNKLDPTRFEVADIYKTSVCPLARVMRYELKKRGIKHLKVVYSKEEPIKVSSDGMSENHGKPVPGSTAFVPSVAGLIIAGEVVKDLIK